MRNIVLLLLFILAFAVILDVSNDELVRSNVLPGVPAAVTNNAVVSVDADEREYLVSFSGMGSLKQHGDIHARTFVLDSDSREWREVGAVPGDVGRLASTAVAVDGKAFVFGGYSVAADDSEVSTPWVHAFDPVAETFEPRRPMPVPVDDAVALAYDDRYVYLISGWHDFGNVNLVQLYDVEADRWSQATPVPGRGVFGHAGGIVDNKMVYCDGVAVKARHDDARTFVANDECFVGIINPENPRRIDWRTIDAHPGNPRYRMAAAGMPDRHGVMFIGGSENPYNYDGIGYDGQPSEPSSGALFFDLEATAWIEYEIDGVATMDHRALVSFDGEWLTVGGMTDGQVVTGRVVSYTFD